MNGEDLHAPIPRQLTVSAFVSVCLAPLLYYAPLLFPIVSHTENTLKYLHHAKSQSALNCRQTEYKFRRRAIIFMRIIRRNGSIIE